MNKQSSLFFNYKGTFSIILLAIVDTHYHFQMLDIWQGPTPRGHLTCLKTPLFRVQRNLAPSPMSLWLMTPSLSEETYWGATLGKNMEWRESSTSGFPMPGEWLSVPLASWLLSVDFITGCLVCFQRWHRRLQKQHACLTSLWGGKIVTLFQCLQCQGHQTGWKQQCNQTGLWQVLRQNGNILVLPTTHPPLNHTHCKCLPQ